MAVDTLKLQVVLAMVDKASGVLKGLQKNTTDVAQKFRDAKAHLRDLEGQQRSIAALEKLKSEMTLTAQKAKGLQVMLEQAGSTSGTTAAQQRKLTQDLDATNKVLAAQKARALDMRAALSSAGVTNLSTAQADLTQKIKAGTAALAAQKTQLDQVMERERKLAAMKAAQQKAVVQGAMVAGAGFGAQAAGGAIKERMQTPINDFMAHEDAMMGIARQVQGARDSAGQLTAIYRTAEAEVRKLSTELPLTTVQIAQMMTAAARMEVPTNELAGFTKQVAHMAMAFDAVPDQIAEAMGKVAKNFKIPLNQISGLADTINYLDDNAISKGADIIDYMNRVSGMASLAKMSSNDYAALGSTLLTLGERTENASTATNAIITKFAMASKGSKKFKEAMASMGVDANAVEAGMATDAMGTLLGVMEKIKAMPEQKQLGVMADLVGQEHADTLAKLINGTEELARQRKLANSDDAKGSMDREAEARKSALSAQLQMAQNRVFNLASALGETLKPALVGVFNRTAGFIEKLQAFAQNNPRFVSAVMTGAFALAGLLATMGTVLITVGPLWAAWAGMGLMMAKAAPLIAVAKTAFMALASAFMWVCRIFMANPIGLVVTAIAAAAFLIYTYWGPIKGFFAGLWSGIAQGASTAWVWITGSVTRAANTIWQLFLNWTLPGLIIKHWDSITTFMTGLGARFATIGGQIMDGLMGGLAQKWEATKAWFANLGTSIADAARNALGIKSPSRVFAEIGGHVMGGLTVGLAKGEADPLARTRDMADKLTQAGAALALPAPTWPSPTAPQLPGLGLPPAVPPAVQVMGQASTAANLPAPTWPSPASFVAQAVPPVHAAPQMPPMAWPALQGDAMRKQLAGLAVSLTLGTAGLGMPAMAQDLPTMAQDLPTDTRTPPLINTAPSPLVTPREPAQGQSRAGGGGGGGGAASSGPIQITINAAPGMDAQAIAKAVAAELDRRERAGKSRVRSAMQDID
ncbi:phage tail tape measure protein [Limnohabitans sp. WS1]|uniref:phage tail tape measure protein n=1 Tax=Limnohabitans sp. WS1 TaxID=1100726 RepID=UPI000D3B1F4C|nr:phage tail tape measure protein [Limnohabitans sp. WS1]PUE20343.1 phage tail tape measure protein [Limnohabitans sp. WS1]